MNILVIDVGGTHVKILASGEKDKREIDSGPTLTARQMVSSVKKLADGWEYDVVSIGYPGPVVTKVINDAAMQALGSYRGGKMLFLGLGTGLGSAIIVDGIVQPMELGHLPYKKRTYEDYVGARALEEFGRKAWRKHVEDIVEYLVAALQPEDVVLGGGNAILLKKIPPLCRLGDNANAFKGGFRMWEGPLKGKITPSRKQTAQAAMAR
jgi:polyphosphate glucokinase